ncbi:MAG: TldD/PmbA family protein [Candidatus Melainabacteria bacterium]|nr:TldD/PmbA family protein [Candidatus Melainabacteria bacterium]
MNLKLLQNKYNLSDLELFTQNISDYKISFVANKLKQAESVHTTGQAIRLVQNKKIGFAANYGLNNISLEEMLTQALEVSRFSPEINIKFPASKEKKEAKKQISTEIEEIISSCKTKGELIIETILNNTITMGNCSPLIDISFDITDILEGLENSNDLSYSHSNKIYSFSMNIRETLENDFIEIFTAAVDDSLPNYSFYADELLWFYKLSKKHAKVKTGTCPVLFTSKASKELLSIVEVALNGKQVNQKSSPWHNKLGEKVLSKSITLKQEPSFGYMARSIDDEGNIVQPLTLLNKGVLENFYYDLLSANKTTQCNSTGNGFKPSLATQPEPSLLNMTVESGKKTLNEIIKNIKYGLLVDQTMGGLSANISGDISVNVDLGFLIENGEIIGRVKDTMISGNIYNALNNVIELSNTPRWYWSNIYSSDMLLDGFMITSK